MKMKILFHLMLLKFGITVITQENRYLYLTLYIISEDIHWRKYTSSIVVFFMKSDTFQVLDYCSYNPNKINVNKKNQGDHNEPLGRCG